jgi:hypothetical protein
VYATYRRIGELFFEALSVHMLPLAAFYRTATQARKIILYCLKLASIASRKRGPLTHQKQIIGISGTLSNDNGSLLLVTTVPKRTKAPSYSARGFVKDRESRKVSQCVNGTRC